MIEFATKPGCVQCAATERKLKQEGVPYVKIDLQDPMVLERAKDAGHASAPVVFLPGGESFGGFRPDLIEAYAKTLKP